VQREFLEANPQRYTGRWVETFFDTAGKQYAGIGFEYLEDEQDFSGLGQTRLGIHRHRCQAKADGNRILRGLGQTPTIL
jgi:hypothetical protein